jgi:hypothetical protein
LAALPSLLPECAQKWIRRGCVGQVGNLRPRPGGTRTRPNSGSRASAGRRTAGALRAAPQDAILPYKGAAGLAHPYARIRAVLRANRLHAHFCVAQRCPSFSENPVHRVIP